MSFYYQWKETLDSEKSSDVFIKEFLMLSDSSLKPLYYGSNDDMEIIYEVLSRTSLQQFLSVIKEMDIEKELTSSDVPIFSTFEAGAIRLNELLEFDNRKLTYEEAGYNLNNAVNKTAKIKYGHNHAHLANMMSLVIIEDSRPALVKSSMWGSYLIKYDLEEKKKVFQKLLLRNLCIRALLKNAFYGVSKYREVVSFLSDSTIKRRRPNVKYLTDYILCGTEEEELRLNIDWNL